MTGDTRLRAMETHATSDEEWAAVYRERMRRGVWRKERVEFYAYVGDGPARQTLGHVGFWGECDTGRWHPDGHGLLDWVAGLHSFARAWRGNPSQAMLRAACIAVEGALNVWEGLPSSFPLCDITNGEAEDYASRLALRAAQDFMERPSPVCRERVRAAGAPALPDFVNALVSGIIVPSHGNDISSWMVAVTESSRFVGMEGVRHRVSEGLLAWAKEVPDA